jgi:hypothetical protein
MKYEPRRRRGPSRGNAYCSCAADKRRLELAAKFLFALGAIERPSYSTKPTLIPVRKLKMNKGFVYMFGVEASTRFVN